MPSRSGVLMPPVYTVLQASTKARSGIRVLVSSSRRSLADAAQAGTATAPPKMYRNITKIRPSARFIRSIRTVRLAPVILQVARGGAGGGAWPRGDPQGEDAPRRPRPP